MARLKVVEPAEAQGETKEVYEAVQEAMGAVPNICKGLANSPAALKALLAMDNAMRGAALTEAERHLVQLVTSQVNGCDYCLSAHTLLGRQSGLSDDMMAAARSGRSIDGREAALIRFARAVVDRRGAVSDVELNEFWQAGYTERHAVEVCAVIAQATFTNYFNHVNETELDFPQAPPVG